MNTRFKKRVYSLVRNVLSETDAQSSTKSSSFKGHETRMEGHKGRVKAFYKEVLENPEKHSFDVVTQASTFFKPKAKVRTSGRKGGSAPKTSTNEGLRKEIRKWRASTNVNMSAKFAQSTRAMQDAGAPQSQIDTEHNRGAKAGNTAYKYYIKLGLSPTQARAKVILKTRGTFDDAVER